MGRNLLSDDCGYQKSIAAQLSAALDRQTSRLAEEYRGQKKAVMVSCLCASALAVILLL